MTLPVPRFPERLVYLGTPETAVPTLEALVAAGHDVVLVVTRPDARRSRRGDPEPSPVKRAAQAHGLSVAHDVGAVASVDADLGVVVAYGRIIPTELLARLPMLNLHFSLLPRWRGAAPLERALLAGDERTGVCVMDVAEGLDEGDIYAREELVIAEDATLESLRNELVRIGTALLVTGLREGFGPPVPQQGEPVYADKLTSDDRRIDFAAGADTLRRVVALGGAWTTFRGRRFKIWSIRTGADGEPTGEPAALIPPGKGVGPLVATLTGWVELVEVQPEGKPRMDATSWANGARLAPDDRLSS